MNERAIFDCHEVIAIAYPGLGQAMQGKIHLSPVPRAGAALSHGVYIEGERALLELRKAVEHALRVRGDRVSRPLEEKELGRVHE
jgi:hypothetical protein